MREFSRKEKKSRNNLEYKFNTYYTSNVVAQFIEENNYF